MLIKDRIYQHRLFRMSVEIHKMPSPFFRAFSGVTFPQPSNLGDKFVQRITRNERSVVSIVYRYAPPGVPFRPDLDEWQRRNSGNQHAAMYAKHTLLFASLTFDLSYCGSSQPNAKHCVVEAPLFCQSNNYDGSKAHSSMMKFIVGSTDKRQEIRGLLSTKLLSA